MKTICSKFIICSIALCFIACAPKLPTQNHKVEQIQTPHIIPSQKIAPNIAQSIDSQPQLDSQKQTSIDSTQALANFANPQSFVIESGYIFTQEESEAQFRATLQKYYTQTSNPQIAQSLLAIEEIIQAQSNLCAESNIPSHCLNALYNGGLNALTFMQYEGAYVQSKISPILLANTDNTTQISYGNGLVWLGYSLSANTQPARAADSATSTAITDSMNFMASFDGISFFRISQQLFQSLIYHRGQFLGVLAMGDFYSSKDGLTWTKQTPLGFSFANPQHISIKNIASHLLALINHKDLYIFDNGTWQKSQIKLQSLDNIVFYRNQYLILGRLSDQDEEQWYISSYLKDFKPLDLKNLALDSATKLWIYDDMLYLLKDRRLAIINTLQNPQNHISAIKLPAVQGESSSEKISKSGIDTTNKEAKFYLVGADNGLFLGYAKTPSKPYIQALYISDNGRDWQALSAEITNPINGTTLHLSHIDSFVYEGGRIYLYTSESHLISFGDGFYHLRLFGSSPFAKLYQEPSTDSAISTKIPLNSSYEIKVLRKVGRFYEVLYQNLANQNNQTIISETSLNTPQKGYILDTQGLPLR